MSATRSTILLEDHRSLWGTHVFGPGFDPDNPTEHFEVTFSAKRWEDLGRPEVLTVTLEPGDRLNEAGFVVDADGVTTDTLNPKD